MNEKNKIIIRNLVNDVKKSMKSNEFDPNGSYTGMPDEGGKPIQDQDDL